MSAVASTANIIIIIHTCLLSLQLPAMTSLSFLRFMSQLIQMNFLSFWPSFKPATLSFLSPSPCVNSTFLHLIIFFDMDQAHTRSKYYFIFFSYHLLLIPLCPHLIKKQHFPLFSSLHYLWRLFFCDFYVLKFINHVSFFALFFWILSSQVVTHVPFFSSEKEGYTLKKKVISRVMHCLKQYAVHGKQLLIGDDDS